MNRWKNVAALIVFLMAAMGCGFGFLNYTKAKSFKKLPTIDLKLLEGKDNIVPFLVLGSGPASLSAALYGSRSGIRTYVLRGNKPGGQLTGTSYIENWPAIKKIRGIEVMNDFEEQVAHFGSIVISDAAATVDLSSWPYKVVTEEGHELYALALMIGTGATPRRLNIPGEGDGEYWGKGVTTCAICDAPYHRGDKVVVIGGGDSAMEEALELSPYAKEVHVLVRSNVLRASVSMIEQVKACVNVTIHYNKALSEIKGDGQHVTDVVVVDTVTNEKTEWPHTRGVFLAIGHVPNTSLFNGYLNADQAGYLKVGPGNQMTNWPGVVAAGDVADPEYRQAGVAAGDGIKAGLDIVWWLASLGFNSYVQEKLEPFFFNPQSVQKKKLEEINSMTDYKELMKNASESVVVLDFFTPYCPSCMHMLPIIEWAAAKMNGKIRFCKVDASIAYDLVKKFKVPDVPHMVVIKNGEIVARLKETMPRAEFYAYMKKFLN
jgi:thioredoxin reductase (NADPH)